MADQLSLIQVFTLSFNGAPGSLGIVLVGSVAVASFATVYTLWVAVMKTKATRARLAAVVWSAGAATGTYFVLRYFGYWAEVDTGRLMVANAGVLASRHVIYPGAYVHGFAYSAWSAALSDIGNVGLLPLQQAIMPFIGSGFVSVLAFPTFRRLMESAKRAAFATTLLFSTSYLVFAISRGSHERLDLAGILVAVLALDHVLRSTDRRDTVCWSLIFLAAAWMLGATNDFFAATFAFVLVLCALFFFAIARLRTHPDVREDARRAVGLIALAAGAAWATLALSVLIYPPVQHERGLLLDFIRHVRAFLTTLRPLSNPYQVAASLYSSRALYLAASVPRWLLFGASLGTFLWQAWLVAHGKRVSVSRMLLLALYLSFGIVLAMAIPVDFLGLSAGTNLEIRVYTEYALFSAPTLAIVLEAVETGTQERRYGLRRPTTVFWIGAFLAPVLVCLAWMTATSDPLLSKNWFFYNPAEIQAAEFALHHDAHSRVWIGANPIGRMQAAYAMNDPLTMRLRAEDVLFGTSSDNPADAVYSPLIAAEALDFRIRLPSATSGDLVYDNGFAQVYRAVSGIDLKRPSRTIGQR